MMMSTTATDTTEENLNNNNDDGVIDATSWPLSWFAALEPNATTNADAQIEEPEEEETTTTTTTTTAASLLLMHNDQQLLQRLEMHMRDVVRTNQYLIAENTQLRRRQAERQAFASDIASLGADHQTQMLDAVLVQQHQLGRLQGDILRALRAFGLSFEIGGAINAGPSAPAAPAVTITSSVNDNKEKKEDEAPPAPALPTTE